MENNISDLFITSDKHIFDALSIINQKEIQIALVVDDSKKLIGTITDGDIRRGLLKGLNLNSSLEEVTNKNFRAINSTDNESNAKLIMSKYRIDQLPVLNNEGIVIDIIVKEKFCKEVKLFNPVVIMAGGLGKRLLPHTSDCPKPMLMVGDKPILEIILLECMSFGLNKFYISVNYLKEQIINYFGNGEKWGIEIEYIHEPKRMGTAGSLKYLGDSINCPFLVLNGDVLTRLNYKNLLDFHKEHSSKATICVKKHDMHIPFGVIKNNGIKLKEISEKPSYQFLINAGVYVINPELLELLPDNEFTDMPTFLEYCKDLDKSINLFPIHEYWIDIGRPETLEEAYQTWESL